MHATLDAIKLLFWKALNNYFFKSRKENVFKYEIILVPRHNTFYRVSDRNVKIYEQST